MKISIITVCLNSEDTILDTLNSVITQDYKDIEHIIVDGGSKDRTIFFLKKYNFKNKKIILKKKCSLYNSINLGIKSASGSIITILHSDDIYNSTNTISTVVKKIKKSNKKLFFGDVVYYKNNFSNIVRYYGSTNFKSSLMKYGFMPPHTGSFYKKNIFQKFGYYKNFKIAGDFEHLLRLIYKNKIKFEILNVITTRMRTGGLSGNSLKSYIIINKELIKSFKINNIISNNLFIFFRIPSKIFQYFFIDKNKINSSFKIINSNLIKNYKATKIKLIRNINKINFDNNFILSALNLAFLGSYSKNEIKLHKNMINWPDGIFSKVYGKRIKKIPGREVLNKIEIPKSIKRIVVIGNLSKSGKKFISRNFKKTILHYKLPFGSIESIKKKANFYFLKSDLIFITLPTPKQEQIAHHLSNINSSYKIICIGGSIGIVSGDEKAVPEYLVNFEFFWRLRYETKRRFLRLLGTFSRYIFDYFFAKKTKEIKIKYI